MPPLVHLAIAQFKAKKGDYAANLERLSQIFAQSGALEPRPQILVLPETALTGYFVEGGVRDLSVTTGTLVRDLAGAYERAGCGAHALDVVVGFYEIWNNILYNSAIYVTLGPGEPIVRHVHRKNFLPTYGLFDEERFVERAHGVRAFDTSWGRAAMLVLLFVMFMRSELAVKEPARVRASSPPSEARSDGPPAEASSAESSTPAGSSTPVGVPLTSSGLGKSLP